MTVPNPSQTVTDKLGIPSVSEAAARWQTRGGPLLVEKHIGDRTTVAVALDARWMGARLEDAWGA